MIYQNTVVYVTRVSFTKSCRKSGLIQLEDSGSVCGAGNPESGCGKVVVKGPCHFVVLSLTFTVAAHTGSFKINISSCGRDRDLIKDRGGGVYI